MTRLLWDQTGEKLYSTGVDRGVLFVHNGSAYENGEAWNGLTSFQTSSDGGTASPIYADNQKYLNLIATEDKKGTIKCYTYPDGWDRCNGKKTIAGVKGLRISQQNRAMFGFSCRTLIGNDTEGTDFGYKLYIVYGATASPSEEEYQTVNDNPNAIEFSYEFSTVPVEVGVPGIKPCAIFEILSTDFVTAEDKAILEDLEDILYGTEDTAARLPSISEVISVLGGTATYKLTMTQGADTTLSVMKGATALTDGADIKAGDELTITVTGGTVTVNNVPFTSGNTLTVAGNTVVVSTKSE
ncbi:MAG: hypothetical protein J6U54_16890 [Clostridiales bacterium]|nr:hypothetical protein [Clostridiales bacterium]